MNLSDKIEQYSRTIEVEDVKQFIKELKDINFAMFINEDSEGELFIDRIMLDAKIDKLAGDKLVEEDSKR